ncbi:hypothetical protein SAMN03159496_04017 [Rhizobium sp. NFR07]|uniref:hypothetical protein n=1 Tax=Rhizobium sp. NFR07 TaxID=1566262 RepID=UPI0008E6D0F2|nr:hypothetical protein [Rhizobium sp. NFR07]SFB46657.1 hypothetical protein SAMN03159496_04017 [Rhizobium sp. NFR07]
MLFGQSVFQSVLTRLKEEETDEEEADVAVADFRIRGLGAGFVAPTEEHSVATEADIEAYFAYLPDEPGEQSSGAGDTLPEEVHVDETQAEGALVPEHLLRLTEAEIAEDLAISADDTEATLADKRRQFAKTNHPDLVAAQFRDNATIRMTIANQLIDRAIKGLFWR